MRKTIIIGFLFCFVQNLLAEDIFSLPCSKVMDGTLPLSFKTNEVFKPFDSNSFVSGVAVSGYIVKNSPDYFVRIILSDVEGKKYLILESYDELNDDSIIFFNNYCEESAFCHHLQPDSIKVYLHDATLYISEIHTTPVIRADEDSLMLIREQRHKEQIKDKIEKINQYNKAHKKLWVADETRLSEMDFTTKCNVLGIGPESPTSGIEYYAGGIFEPYHTTMRPVPSSSLYVDHFSWRDRQGKDWMTEVKDQEWSSFCTVFAAISCTEALTNLYFNKKLDLDLSEQEIIDCSDTSPHYAWESFNYSTVLNYLENHGVCDEDSYELNICYNPADCHPTCKSDSITPVETVRISGDDIVYSSVNDLKSALITKGPLLSGWQGHAMALVGYNTIHAGDSLYYYDNSGNLTLIDSIGNENEDPRVGRTYWIFKNNHLVFNGQPYDGYLSILFPEYVANGESYVSGMTLNISFDLPIISSKYTDDDIAIVDEDGDGYYYWGIGERPSTCPPWIPTLSDGDDTDPTKHEMDAYGNFPPTYSFPIGTDLLSHNRTITENESLTSNLELYHGVTLTITGSLYCLENTKIISNGGTIVVDGGVLANAEIDFDSFSSIIIRNGGTIYLKKNVDFDVPTGCIMTIEEGKICPHYEKR